MKKFNPQNELQKAKSKSFSKNNSKLSNLYVPLLVIACSCLAMSAVTFSAKLVDETKNKFTIRIDIVNGEQDVYLKNVAEGPFNTVITSSNLFQFIECSDGELNYDVETSTVFSNYVNQNTRCTLVFGEEDVKEIHPNGLDGINDNTGRSYYYKADRVDNYVMLNNMMFRIVRTNGNGTIRLILDDSLLTSVYGNTNDYYDSTLKATLEEWFNTNFNGESYLVEADFDVTNYVGFDKDNLINLNGYHYGYVGTLSAIEASLITDGIEGNNYLNEENGIYLLNANGIDNVYAYRNGEVIGVSPTETLTVKPVINIKAEFVGEGTLDNPYIIKES